jgi:hypothetical protein
MSDNQNVVYLVSLNILTAQDSQDFLESLEIGLSYILSPVALNELHHDIYDLLVNHVIFLSVTGMTEQEVNDLYHLMQLHLLIIH